MKLSDYFVLAWRSIWERKGRTIGSIIGIIIAVLALGAAMGIGVGLKYRISNVMKSSFGVNVIYVFTSGTQLLTDAQIVQLESLPYVSRVIPITDASATIYINGRAIGVVVLPTTLDNLPHMVGASSLQSAILEGKPILAPGTAIVGYELAFTKSGIQVIYPGQKIVIRTLSGRYITLTVTAILAPTHPTMYGNPNKAIFVNYETFFDYISPIRMYFAAAVFVSSVSKIPYVANLIKKLFPTYEIFNPQIILKQYMMIITGIEIFLTVVAAVGTLIIGLWMFDTMTMSVLQRTREIGVMKAVGFTSRQIFFLVLFEAIAISLVGVVIGDAMLLVISKTVTVRLGPLSVPIVPTPPILLLVTIVPVLVNVIAALGPARRATMITPLQALRSE
ncbi:MAG: FtsX-like permease family protein [Crenarchaeota archaeon]|nr:FtsX-like permease family protein [Thermoproteota archaeon]